MTTATVLVVSAKAVGDPAENRGGPIAVDLLTRAGCQTQMTVLGPDDLDTALASAVAHADVVVTLGGTSVRPEDRVPEATRALGLVEIPGIAEEIRRRGAEASPASLCSRGLCGVVTTGAHQAIVLNAPSSRGGVRDAVGLLTEVLPHLLRDLVGGSRC